MDGVVEWGRGGLCLLAGWKPWKDLAEMRRFLRLEEGRKVWMLVKQTQSARWDLMTKLWSEKQSRVLSLSSQSLPFVLHVTFYAAKTNPVWSFLCWADLLVCSLSRWSWTFLSTGGLSLFVCGMSDERLKTCIGVSQLLHWLHVVIWGGCLCMWSWVIDDYVIWFHNLQNSSINGSWVWLQKASKFLNPF